jgi:hypothetical protein
MTTQGNARQKEHNTVLITTDKKYTTDKSVLIHDVAFHDRTQDANYNKQKVHNRKKCSDP